MVDGLLKIFLEISYVNSLHFGGGMTVTFLRKEKKNENKNHIISSLPDLTITGA